MSELDHRSPDVLVFFSDQHTGRLLGTQTEDEVDTPNLSRFAAEGTRFLSAYTSCPLCVPARFGFLTGRLPSRTGVFTNGNVMPSDLSTLAHCFGAGGYETVLCGRMHFCGQDQRHGFARRLVGDFTPCIPGRGGGRRADLGPYVSTPAGDWPKYFGGGTSPVLEYDRAVVTAAREELARPHDRPLLLVVGTYGPHHTFVAPPELYAKYLDLVEPPIRPEGGDMHPVVRTQVREDPRLTPEAVRQIRAAYYGLIEHVDQQFGRVVEAWDARLARTNGRGLACYLSDHGEQAGQHGLWGKMSFYEDSAAIPLMFRGVGVPAGRCLQTPVSILDVAPTLCEMGGVPSVPHPDGISLADTLRDAREPPERPILSEIYRGGICGRMVRMDRWKYVAYRNPDADASDGSESLSGEDVLFDLQCDPHETRNVLPEHPEQAGLLREAVMTGWDPQAIVQEQRRRQEQERIFAQWGWNSPVPEPDRWPVPRSAWRLPER